MTRPLRVAVFVSGAGTTLDALAEHAPARGAVIALVVADRANIPALEVAARHGIPATVIPVRGAEPAGLTRELDRALTAARVDLVVLAGLRSVLPSEWVDRWAGRVVNVHPSLLPRYGGPGMYGARVYDAILSAGDTESGATVHLVTAEIDAGPVLLQEGLAIDAGETRETLQAKTQALERRLLLETIARFADGRWPLPYDPSEGRGADPGRRIGAE